MLHPQAVAETPMVDHADAVFPVSTCILNVTPATPESSLGNGFRFPSSTKQSPTSNSDEVSSRKAAAAATPTGVLIDDYSVRRRPMTTPVVWAGLVSQDLSTCGFHTCISDIDNVVPEPSRSGDEQNNNAADVSRCLEYDSPSSGSRLKAGFVRLPASSTDEDDDVSEVDSSGRPLSGAAAKLANGDTIRLTSDYTYYRARHIRLCKSRAASKRKLNAENKKRDPVQKDDVSLPCEEAVDAETTPRTLGPLLTDSEYTLCVQCVRDEATVDAVTRRWLANLDAVRKREFALVSSTSDPPPSECSTTSCRRRRSGRSRAAEDLESEVAAAVRSYECSIETMARHASSSIVPLGGAAALERNITMVPSIDALDELLST